MNRALCFTLLLVGCGGGGTPKEKTQQVTCDIQSSSIDTCTIAIVPDSQVADYGAACVEENGTVSTDPCTRPDAFGVCSGVVADGITATITYYHSDSDATQAGAATACSNQGGSFVSNSSLGYTCSSDSYCVQFGDLTADQLEGAKTYCDDEYLPTPKIGTCATTLRAGTCAVSSSSLGAITVSIYDADGNPPSTCQTVFDGTWTPAS